MQHKYDAPAQHVPSAERKPDAVMVALTALANPPGAGGTGKSAPPGESGQWLHSLRKPSPYGAGAPSFSR